VDEACAVAASEDCSGTGGGPTVAGIQRTMNGHLTNHLINNFYWGYQPTT